MLKLAKSDKSNTGNGTLRGMPTESPSALSRSMKYAEPWLYGTMRGVPTSNGANYDYMQPQYTIMPELAVVLCSCREYLTGTKRDIKKATVCKKCKGSRLPITPVGGTMRIHSTQCMVPASHRNSAGTMRLPSSTTSSSKQRPSILATDNDPYDVMRRSRLISPDPKPSTKSRAKSSSPTRNKDRNAGTKQNASPAANGVLGTLRLTKKDSRSRSATRIIDIESNWTTESMDSDTTVDAMATRRSILQCNVNPYELISKSAHNNEFAPLHGDDVYDMHSQKYENLLNSLHDHKMISIPMNGINTMGREQTMTNARPNRTIVQTSSFNDDDAYENVSYSPMTVTTTQVTAVVNHSTYAPSVKIPPHVKTTTSKSDSSTIPRNRLATNNNRVNGNEHATIATIAAASPRSVSIQETAPSAARPVSAHIIGDNGSATIKSILKRAPASATSAPSVGAPDNNRNVGRPTATTAPSSNGVPVKNLTVRRLPPKKVPTSLAVTPTYGQNTKNNIHTQIAGNNNQRNIRSIASATAAVTAAVAIADGTLRAKQMTGAHFYLPLPQRKKVQFSVEHEVIDENGSIENGDINVGTDADADVRLTDVTANDRDNVVGCVDKTTAAATLTTLSATTTAASEPKAIGAAAAAATVADVKVNGGGDMTVQRQTFHSGYETTNGTKDADDESTVTDDTEAKTGERAHFFYYFFLLLLLGFRAFNLIKVKSRVRLRLFSIPAEDFVEYARDPHNSSNNSNGTGRMARWSHKYKQQQKKKTKQNSRKNLAL